MVDEPMSQREMQNKKTLANVRSGIRPLVRRNATRR
jgi:hypothetical protein